MAKIRVITPVHSLPKAFADNILKELVHLEKFGLEFDNVFITAGPNSIECHFDEALSVPYTVAAIIEAEKAGIDACIINCMGDPGLQAAREVVSIPVMGPCEASMHAAAMMGHKFSVVTVLDSVRPMFLRNADAYGLGSKLASVRVVNVPVLDIGADESHLVKLIAREAIDTVQRDHADCVILGCTGFLGMADEVEKLLRAEGFAVPVINPMPTASVMAAAFVQGGFSHSARAYPAPNRNKQIEGFAIPQWTAKL
ncbi:aspartate/glutamate racemase family protein [Govanella unica]|uniref:Aspartate/glutamate racemase family protein n=1 Tax=Govanella unica TaxID=2975056 RepID=A0A9X3Z8T5_9PROT|nr:aspartate/glutamate racemase family protein [Govania unica]MDA5195124.1 aspartate/glutamate racemase family protein [Govania unica]